MQIGYTLFEYAAYVTTSWHYHLWTLKRYYYTSTMAMSKELLDEQAKIEDHDTDLTLCGICEASIEDPKALPCLHTFCLGCIKEWAEGKTGDKITCPLCKEDFVIPPEGVTGFRSNFFVTKLKKTQAMKEEMVHRKVTTSCCESAGSAVARCLDCKEYLCANCVQAHKTITHFKSHQVYSFDDIQSGKVDVHKLHVQEYCTKHKGQVLWFFCESCGILICRDCTVVDHPASTHTLVNVEEVSGMQSEKMESLASQCQKVAEKVADAITIAGDVEIDLEKALLKAKQNIEQAKLQIIEHLKVQQQKCEDEIARVEDKCRTKITVGKDKLQSQQSQLRRALDMADTVTKRGSPYDLAAIYTTLTDTMQKLADMEPLILSSELADVKFLPDDDFQILTLGTLATQGLSGVAEYDLSGEWEMDQQICTDNKLSRAVGITLYPSGDFAIADSSNGQVKFFNQDGTFKYDIDVKQDAQESKPIGVAISGSNVYVTDMTPFVNMFDSNAKLINQFQTVSTALSSEDEESSLFGLTIDHDDQIIVGDYSNSYISIHKLSGTHISSFDTNIKPVFIATAPNNTIIVSEWSASAAQIMDYAGQVLHTLDKPTGVDIAWKPAGMCYNGDKEFLIASGVASKTNPGKKAGIHHYTTAGDYLGCITTEVENPRDVAITRDGKILVLEWTSVKVFTKKEAC